VLVTTEGELPPGIPLLAESLFTWIPPGVEISTDASEPGELVQIVRLPGRANADTLDEDDGHEATTLFYSARETPEQPSLREDERHESFDINGELGVLRGRHGDMLLTWRYGPYLLTLSNRRETNRDGETGLMQEELRSLARNILPVGVASREGERVEQGWPLWWRPDTEVMNSPASRLPPPRGPIAWRDGSRLLRFDEPYLDGAECRQTLTASLDALRTCASWQGEPDPIGFVIRVWQLARDYDLLRRVVRFHPAVLGVYSVGLGPLLILNLRSASRPRPRWQRCCRTSTQRPGCGPPGSTTTPLTPASRGPAPPSRSISTSPSTYGTSPSPNTRAMGSWWTRPGRCYASS